MAEMQKNNKETIKESFSLEFAEKIEDRTEQKAEEMATKNKFAKGIACFVDDDGNKYWGVLVNRGEDAKKEFTKEKKQEENV